MIEVVQLRRTSIFANALATAMLIVACSSSGQVPSAFHTTMTSSGDQEACDAMRAAISQITLGWKDANSRQAALSRARQYLSSADHLAMSKVIEDAVRLAEADLHELTIAAQTRQIRDDLPSLTDLKRVAKIVAGVCSASASPREAPPTAQSA